MTKTDIGDRPARTPPSPPLSAGEKILRWAVYVMGVLLIAGLAGLILAIVTRLQTPPQPSPQPLALPEPFTLTLPERGRIVSQSLAGDRLAVHIAAEDGSSTGSRIVVIDLTTGRIIATIAAQPDNGPGTPVKPCGLRVLHP